MKIKNMATLTAQEMICENGGIIPRSWSQYPGMANELILDKFLAFKTPLTSVYDKYFLEHERLNVDMVFKHLEDKNLKLGLWIDLTNTRNLYQTNSIRKRDCQYLKLYHRDGEPPSEMEVRTFIEHCKRFMADKPQEIIGVHSTHGINRTGFFIICYLVEMHNVDVNRGLAEFAAARPPGINRQDYIILLHERYTEEASTINKPPQEKDNKHQALSIEQDDKSVFNLWNLWNQRYINSSPMLIHVPGVTPVLDNELLRIRERLQKICQWHYDGFPGPQPVYMNTENMAYLKTKPYRVFWMTNGTKLVPVYIYIYIYIYI